MTPHTTLVDRLLDLLNRVRQQLGQEPLAADADTHFADALDSMGFVEFLAWAAEDSGLSVEAIEQAAERRYRTIGELAAVISSLLPGYSSQHHERGDTLAYAAGIDGAPRAWLAATAAELPANRQSASETNALLHRPAGWLEKHAGIQSRCLWGNDDPLDAAARAAHDCLRQAGLSPDTIGALLVTSEAPPVPIGLAAALHARIGLPPGCPALEIGGACTGFLNAVWTARHLLRETSAVLAIAVEAPSRWLMLSPTAAGEAAALFGDAAAACLLTAQPLTAGALGLRDIVLGTDGAAGSILRVEMESGRAVELHMEGIAVAHRAVRAMADAVRQLCARNDLPVEQLAAVIAHGGNGRMPALLARRLGLPSERVFSEVTRTGNLGSASLPIAWNCRDPRGSHSVIWTAVGAGLQWGAALLDARP